MTRDVFVLLAAYNRGVNEKMNGFIRGLSDGEWNREFQGYFPSVRALCSHLYICDFNWLKRFGNLREFKVLQDQFFDRSLSYAETLFPGKDEYLEKRPEIDKKLVDLVAEIQDEDLSKIIQYKDSRGTVIEKQVEAPLLQMFNHQTHHRGMISLYLEFLGRENDFSAVMPIVY